MTMTYKLPIMPRPRLRLEKRGTNQTVLHLPNGASVLFSYETPVAALRPSGGFVQSSAYYSATTTRHVNSWLRHNGRDPASVETVDHDELETYL